MFPVFIMLLTIVFRKNIEKVPKPDTSYFPVPNVLYPHAPAIADLDIINGKAIKPLLKNCINGTYRSSYYR